MLNNMQQWHALKQFSTHTFKKLTTERLKQLDITCIFEFQNSKIKLNQRHLHNKFPKRIYDNIFPQLLYKAFCSQAKCMIL